VIREFLRSRGARKFRKSRLAVASLGVIAAYAAIAVFVLVAELFVGLQGDDFDLREHPVLSAFTIEGTTRRVGANSVAGFGARQGHERRADQHEFFLNRLERALDANDVEGALGRLWFGARTVAPLDEEALGEGLERGWELFDSYDEELDLLDELLDEQDEAVEERADTADVDARLAAQEAVIEERVDEIGAVVVELFPHPTGFDGAVYSTKMLLGTDRQGRSILVRGVYSIKTAIQVGIVTALVSVLVGSLLGAAAAVFGGWTDMAVIWLYSTFSSVPNLVLLSVLSISFSTGVLAQWGDTMIPLYTAFCLTFWIGPARVIRGEALKIKELEYVQAATAIGFSRVYTLIKHVLPNTLHLIFINFALLFVAAIKSEVILTFLGLGLKNGASWGIMINEAKPEVVNGVFWQIGAATGFMFVLVLAFNVFTDSLQDAFDPKHVDR
jgi:peptide/nickel transport system permease protein